MKKTEQLTVNGRTVWVTRSRRKTLALFVTDRGEVVAKAPLRMSDREIAAFAAQKEEWVKKALSRVAAAALEAAEAGPLTAAEIADLRARAKVVLPARAALYAEKMGVSYTGVTIRLQKTRWGSCSAKGHLNFNALLMLAPPEVRDSVVVHELCHLKEMNHSRRFYALLYAIMPDYDERHQWLSDHGAALQARVREKER